MFEAVRLEPVECRPLPARVGEAQPSTRASLIQSEAFDAELQSGLK